MKIWLGLTMLAACGVAVTAALQARAAGEPGKEKVLKHMVLYSFKPEVTPEQLKEVIETFAALPKKIDKIIGFEHGENVSKEGKSDGLTYGFVVTFRNEKDLAEYIAHPAHQDYVKVAAGKRDKVIVFDYWVEK